jgi:carbamoyltransferase
MIICGLKLTHDASIALIDGQRLIFCYEMEKLDNSPRYSTFNISLQRVREIFDRHGYRFENVDEFVIDGWTPSQKVCLDFGSGNEIIDLAEYGSFVVKQNVMEKKRFRMKSGLEYSSYLHVAGHVASAYCTSPMAGSGEDSYVLIWDGGMYPQLFYYYARTNVIENVGLLFPIIGNVYAIFSQHFGPFKTSKEVIDDLSVAGKVMAYIAKGTFRQEMIPVFQSIYKDFADRGMDFGMELASEFIRRTSKYHYPAEDILCTFHTYLEGLLVERLEAKLKKDKWRTRNLCFAGGSALNIKWNSAIRNTGLFDKVWVPPFPNDSGSSIGAACCGMIERRGCSSLEWDVFSGPALWEDFPIRGWKKKRAEVDVLALQLFLEDEPIVFLNGRAELGPRALGNRSILAPATGAYMKGLLNHIKGREEYRPVAPICLEEGAKDIFIPGTPDPYMLFDHIVRPEWKARIPAVCHIDGTARLQTVNAKENPVIYGLLCEYKKLSGTPLLCNTSANYNGKGFFPDISSAMQWGGVNYVWSANTLYQKEEKVIFPGSRSVESRPL